MLVTSLEFIFIFLPLVLSGALCVTGQRLLVWITVMSFGYYAFAGHAWFLLPMLATTVVDFYVAQKIYGAGPVAKRAWLCLSLSLSVGLLVYFKGSGVMVAGISFYSFQTMSYIIDVYRGRTAPTKNFWLFAAFVSFFPHLVAGPLTRHDQLMPPLSKIAREGIRPE